MEQVKGYVEHIIYRNDDNGYTVMNLMNGEEEIVCVGNFRTIDLGETLEVSGNYTEHPMYGMQLKAESYRVVEPDDEAGMERYLASGAIKGIGAALASRIIKKFGKDTFRIIEEEPERLAEIKGISLEIAPVFSACHHSCQIKRKYNLIFKKVGHLVFNDSLRA